MIYVNLKGDRIAEELEEIKRKIDQNTETVFVYSGKDALYNYIDALSNMEGGLDSEYLYKFKVCYENEELMVSYSREGKRNITIQSMHELINELDAKNNCRIVVENDSRVQLSFIVQQLIYIEYPLDKVDILLRKEEEDADKIKRYMDKVDELLCGCDDAIERLEKYRYEVETGTDDRVRGERIQDIDNTLESCYEIKAQIKKSKEVELNLAIAASKKAGKSVIVNCFLGEQIAPTSTELPTPNNCFYKKSNDGRYHLWLEGDDESQEFFDRKAIYKVIDGHFKKAQSDKESGFTLPDMHISYVTDENNFSSYTISDTAGPDLAVSVHKDDGQTDNEHEKAAWRAMEQCDVAVFAIDYSKHLIVSEEDYLRRIKEMFTKHGKFHSLMFALNKIDVRYTDVDAPKSFIMSVDHIKTHLADIDEAYRDCIIFPTCSLEYFSAIVAEKAGVTELKAENNLNIDKMKKVKFDHKDVPELAWLHTHSENLEYYHGFETISYDIFKKDSGMPALMSYVSYVAQSKARDEIVNNVTFQISTQRERIQSVLNYVGNLESLIRADDKKISDISGIILDYSDKVHNILDKGVEFSSDELNVLDVNDLMGMRWFKGDFNKAMDEQNRALKASFNKSDVADIMYNEMRDKVWNKIQKYNEITGNQIGDLFGLSDFISLADEVMELKVEEASTHAGGQLKKISGEVKKIVDYRKKLLNKASEECRERLSKEEISIKLPAMPDFEFATAVIPADVSEIRLSEYDIDFYNKLEDLFKKKFWANIGKTFGRILGLSSDKDFVRKRYKGERKHFNGFCNKHLKSDFRLTVIENDIPHDMYNAAKKSVIDCYMKGMIDELKMNLSNMNKTYISCVDLFRLAVDDRDKYKENIALLNLRRDTINKVSECMDKFMGTWNEIVQNMSDNDIENI